MKQKDTLNEAQITLECLYTATMKVQQAISESYRTCMANAEMRKQLEKACSIIENVDTTLRVKVNRITDKIAYDNYVEGINEQLRSKQSRRRCTCKPNTCGPKCKYCRVKKARQDNYTKVVVF